MTKAIQSGIYIVIDPAQDTDKTLDTLKQIKNESIAAVQIWDNPEVNTMDEKLLSEVRRLFKNTSTPLLINNRWELLKKFDFDGIHFDVIPENYDQFIVETDRKLIKGITLSNDLGVVEKADHLGFDYVSFCAMFPSKTVSNCEIVRPENVIKCREITKMPIFLSGGIHPDNIKFLRNLSFQGIAVVSGIMNTKDPKKALSAYQVQLENLSQ